ncbi:MAG: 3-phosphoshikimate 1-carboxyvinyltransferase [Ignavibacteriales bacterium]|nr:3-phosphoshikimate 1-carboxyvinyltransferase [Ignavibacteriales bacterium]
MNLTIPQIHGLKGNLQIPGDKSISHRALMIGALADGVSEVSSCSHAADPLSTLSCIKQLGVQVQERDTCILIHGKGRRSLKESSTPLDAGNSGTTMRLLSGILVGQNFHSVLLGDSSLCQRPMKRIMDPLRQMGANIHGTEKNTAPLFLEPVEQLHAIQYTLPVPSAQVKSAVLFAGLFADSQTTIIENSKSRDHTERMLGLHSEIKNGSNVVVVHPNVKIEGKKFFVPGDISAAAFFLSAGLIVPGSNFIIQNVGLNPTRKHILDVFKTMGGHIKVENEQIIEGEPLGDLVVQYSELKSNLDLRGAEVVDLIDEIPILAVTALFAEGTFSIHDARELRAKETDRISAIVNNLRLLGCEVEEYEDGFAFEGKKQYSGTVIPSYGDHRIAMSFGIAGLIIPNITIENTECAEISFPEFWQKLLSSPRI